MKKILSLMSFMETILQRKAYFLCNCRADLENLLSLFKNLPISNRGDFFVCKEFNPFMTGLSPAYSYGTTRGPVGSGFRPWGDMPEGLAGGRFLQGYGHRARIGGIRSLVAGAWARITCNTKDTATMRRMKLDQKAQNLIEYAIVVAIVISAMTAMSIYVFRSVQATQQAIQEEAAR